jgi:predicted MPP superfamily phosphohydrolase
MAIFLGLILAILFGAHFLAYVSLVHFFGMAGAAKNALFWSFALLSISFPLASALARFQENALTQAFYFAAGVWLGFLVNLLLAVAAVWLLVLLAKLFSVGASAATLAKIALVAAVAVSGYGVWHALHPQIRNVTVNVPNLPEAWKGQRIVHLTDVHLGHVYRRAFLQGVVDQVNGVDPKLVVITGDLFDGMDGPLEDFVRPLDDIRAKDGVLFVDGNHETYLGLEKAFGALEATDVRVLRDEAATIDGLNFLGVSYPERGQKKDIVATVAKLRAQAGLSAGATALQAGDGPSVLLYHAPVRVEEMAGTGIDLQLSGHTHRGQQWPFRYVTHAVHKGYDYGLYRVGNYSLYVGSGVGTWGPTMRIGTDSEIVVITLE